MPRRARGEKRPDDVIRAAIIVTKLATGEIERARGNASIRPCCCVVKPSPPFKSPACRARLRSHLLGRACCMKSNMTGFACWCAAPGKPVRYTHWGNLAWCSQEMLSIERARDHYGQSFVCVAESYDFCGGDGQYRDGDNSGLRGGSAWTKYRTCGGSCGYIAATARMRGLARPDVVRLRGLCTGDPVG
jgi:hypothetical protein